MNSLERNVVLSIAKTLHGKAQSLRDKHPGTRISETCGMLTGTDMLAHEMADSLKEVANALRIIAEGQ